MTEETDVRSIGLFNGVGEYELTLSHVPLPADFGVDDSATQALSITVEGHDMAGTLMFPLGQLRMIIGFLSDYATEFNDADHGRHDDTTVEEDIERETRYRESHRLASIKREEDGR